MIQDVSRPVMNPCYYGHGYTRNYTERSRIPVYHVFPWQFYFEDRFRPVY